MLTIGRIINREGFIFLFYFGSFWTVVGITIFFRKRITLRRSLDLNPLGAHPLRDKADKPWLFFAGCYEWKRYKEEGPGFRSHLPISMDGSCNGYQHLSALARDPCGGEATNLVPDDEPQDIYLKVAEFVSIKVQVDAEYLKEGADRELLGKIDRSTVKPATMTTPYDVTRMGVPSADRNSYRPLFSELLSQVNAVFLVLGADVFQKIVVR